MVAGCLPGLEQEREQTGRGWMSEVAVNVGLFDWGTVAHGIGTDVHGAGHVDTVGAG